MRVVWEDEIQHKNKEYIDVWVCGGGKKESRSRDSTYKSSANVVRSGVDLDDINLCSYRSDTHRALVTAMERNGVLVFCVGRLESHDRLHGDTK